MNRLLWENFQNYFHESWHLKIKDIIESEEVYNIYQHLKQRGSAKHLILPKSDRVFEAFRLCDYNNLKLVMLLQEPYSGLIAKVPQADGLCMSSTLTGKIQPSLKAFFEGIEKELDTKIEHTPDLTYLAEQGVLLGNYSLTVEYQKIGIHTQLNLWRPFWKLVIEEIFNKYNPGLIYLLLGKDALKVKPFILPFNNYIFEANHPSFYARSEEAWDSKGTIKKINAILKENNGIDFCISWDKTDLDEPPF